MQSEEQVISGDTARPDILIDVARDRIQRVEEETLRVQGRELNGETLGATFS